MGLLTYQVILFCFIKILFAIFIFSASILASLDGHLQQMDPTQAYPIPNVSARQPINPLMFRYVHIQPGLVNDSNCCCLISVLMCFHRLAIVNFFSNPSRMMRNGSPDFSLMTLYKILRACPSNLPFSIRSFITSWNRDARGMQLGQNEDLYIVDGILKSVTLEHQTNVPVLTEYTASYFCPWCQLQYNGVTEWSNQSFDKVPELPLPDQQQPVNPADLMTQLMNDRFHVFCQVCQQRVNDAQIRIDRGKFTIIRVNRATIRNRRLAKIMTPLDCGPSNSPGGQFLGDLVAVVSHRSRGGLHWVSYTRADNVWYINNDDRQPVPSSPFNTGRRDETINMLCYINN